MAADGSFLLFSDVHFDPFADPSLVPALAASDVSAWKDILKGSAGASYSGYGKNSNFALFESALDDMARRAGDVRTVIFPGDILAHDFDQTYAAVTGDASPAGLSAFIQKTAAFFVQEVDSRFPKATVLVTVGNNDSVLGDYGSVPGDPYLSGTAPVMAQAFFNTDADRAAFATGWSMGGYYALEPDGPTGLKYIVLNDVFGAWSVTDPGPGMVELAWFQTELADAAQDFQKVWVVTHIPPGADSYLTAKSASSPGGLSYTGDLNDPFNNAFVALETVYGGTIQASFAGHVHRDDFRLFDLGPTDAPVGLMRTAPAISPVYGNNPGYQIYTYDTQAGTLFDETTYGLDLTASKPSWSLEYDYAQTYGQTLATPAEWATTYAEILANPASRAAYMAYHNGNASTQTDITSATLPVYWLAIGQTTPAAFNAVAALASV